MFSAYPQFFPRLRWASALCCSALALGTPLAGAAPPANNYFTRSWLIDNGLPDNWVSSVTQDPRGFLWLGTMTGLVRFDGRSFQEFPLPDALRVAGENIRALALEDPSTLVLVPASGGILRFRNGRYVRHPVDAALRGQQLQQLYVEPDGTLWIGNDRGEIFRWRNERVTSFPKPAGVSPGLAGFSVATDARGQTWLAEGSFLGRFENDQLIRSALPTGPGFLAITPARSGGIWIASNERLMKWDDDRLTTLSAGSAWLPGQNFVQRIFEDHDGVLWIATRRSGLFQLADGQVRAVNSHQQRLSWIAEDTERGIWSASLGGGITRLQRQRFQMLYPESGDREIASTAVCEDRTGALWSADRSFGVVRYRDGTAQRLPDPPGVRSFYANSVAPDDAGHIWVGAVSGLYRTAVDHPGPLELIAPSLKDIHVLHFSARGDLWIGSAYTRLGRLHQGLFDELTASRGYPGSFVVAIAETADGTTWIAMEHELYAYRNDRLVRESALDGFVSERLNVLYGDAVGALWIGSSRGLLRLKDGHLTAYTQAAGLPNDRIEQLMEDDHGVLWIGSRRGFFHVARAELEAFADGRVSHVTAVTFGPEEGLTGQVPVPNCQPDAWKGHDGRIWFCTQQGVLGINADAVPQELPPPPVYVDRVNLDGRDVGAGSLRFQTGHHRLAFYFSSPNFAAPEKVRLRHRLRGLDTEWIETGSDQEANYADLPAGRYTLEVAASNPNGVWRDGIGAAITVSVVPAWRDTWWARAIAIAAFAGAVAWLVRFTSHRLLRLRLKRIEQEHALEKERARIARDLHDELGGSLTQIRLLADRLKRRPDKSDLEPGLNQLARQTRRLAGELESIIWTVNPRNNSLDRFARFVLQFAPRFFRDTAISCTVFGVEKVPARRLTPEVQHHLLSATKEAMTNVLKHSEANLVVISLHYAAGILRMAIHDNGLGFDPAAAANEERNGLSNMRSRLAEIGGVLEIHSLLGQGTTVSWQVPIPADARVTARPAPALAEP